MCKHLDGRDWPWEKLGLALVSRALLSKTLIQLSADVWGCTSSLLSYLASGYPALGSVGSAVGLMVTSKRAYIKEGLPGLLLPVPLSLWEAPANPHLHMIPFALASK